MTRVAYFDCMSGISGDMTLGALIDAGADADAVRAAIRSLGLADVSIEIETVKKCGFRALQVTVDHPPEHAHRHLHQIEAMIDVAGEVSEAAKQLSKDVFRRLGEAEAKVHGTTLEKVHFHEVGAVDSIADIVGAAVAFDSLGIDSVACSPVPTGHGQIKIAHGTVSVPAPATAELLRGIPLAPSNVAAELTTPTGAALVKTTATSFGPLPEMTVRAVGYGAGSRDLEGQANLLRVILGDHQSEPPGSRQLECDRVVVLETNIDDSTPQQLADCADRLMSAGALDVFQIPCVMKKGRPGILFTVVAAESKTLSLEDILFRHTSSIGVRRRVLDRHKLPRRCVVVETEFGPIRGKVVDLPDGDRRFSVEDEDARAAAASYRVSAATVRHTALESWLRTR